MVHGEAWGNLYLTEKAGGEFTEEDEEAVTVLADWAAIAIANSRLYRDVRERRDELAAREPRARDDDRDRRALGGITDLDRVLELIAKRSRALIDARATELALLDGDEVVVAAAAGRGCRGAAWHASGDRGLRRRRGADERASAAPARGAADSFANRVLGAHSALVVPHDLPEPGDRRTSARSTGSAATGAFTEEDERLLQAFAASAATAVATAQTAGAEALRRSLHASEEERRRWARELHDETLQELAGLKVLLAGRAPQRRLGALDGSPRSGDRVDHAWNRESAGPDHRPATGRPRRARDGSRRSKRSSRASRPPTGLRIELDVRARLRSRAVATRATRRSSSLRSTGSCRRR